MADPTYPGEARADSRSPRLPVSPRTGLVATVTTYLLIRVIQWVLSLPTIVGPDSHSFLPGDGLAPPPNWYFGFEKVSFTGDGVIRPWTVALPYALLGADFIRSFAQMLFSAGAFLLLAWALWQICRPRALGMVLASTVLGISLTTLVTSWDMLLNRESIAISLTALLVATALLAISHHSWPLYLTVNLIALLLTITRPTIAPLTVGVLAALIIIRWVQQRGSESGIRFVSAGVGLGLIAVTLIYPAWFSSRMDESWTKWYGHTMSETQFGYVVSDYNPRAESLKAALEADGAPSCLTDSLPVYTGEYVGAPWGFAAHMRDTCPGFTGWYQENWPRWYYRYMTDQPDYIAKVTIAGLPLALHPWDNGETMSLLPASARDLVFPDQAGAEGLGEYDPLFLYWAVVIGVAVAAVAHRRSSRTRRQYVSDWFQGNWQWVLLIGAMVIGSLISIVISLLLIPSYPLETNRVNVSTALLLRGAGVTLAITLLWKLACAVRRPAREKPIGM